MKTLNLITIMSCEQSFSFECEQSFSISCFISDANLKVNGMGSPNLKLYS